MLFTDIFQKDNSQNIWKKPYVKFILVALVIFFILFFWSLYEKVKMSPPTKRESKHVSLPCHRETTAAINERVAMKKNIPLRTNVAENTQGEKITVMGIVLDTDCHPLSQAVVTLWQTDASGKYDDHGYNLYGQQYTDVAGRYMFQTIIPGLSGNRAPHLNFTIQANKYSPLLTTQLFFPDIIANNDDPFYDDGLLLKMNTSKAGKTGTYNFIVERR